MGVTSTLAMTAVGNPDKQPSYLVVDVNATSQTPRANGIDQRARTG
jgi:hypothetical protein